MRFLFQYMLQNKQQTFYTSVGNGVASPEILGKGKMFGFRRITLFCLEKRFSKHKMTIFSKNLGGAMAPLAPTGYAYVCRPFSEKMVKSFARLMENKKNDTNVPADQQ